MKGATGYVVDAAFFEADVIRYDSQYIGLVLYFVSKSSGKTHRTIQGDRIIYYLRSLLESGASEFLTANPKSRKAQIICGVSKIKASENDIRPEGPRGNSAVRKGGESFSFVCLITNHALTHVATALRPFGPQHTVTAAGVSLACATQRA